jgi:hypothetical protein
MDRPRLQGGDIAIDLESGELWRGQLFQLAEPVTWPDGTVAQGFRFRHALYQEVVYERLPYSQRAAAHRRIGAREEHAYGGRVQEIAAELAIHFEQARLRQGSAVPQSRGAAGAPTQRAAGSAGAPEDRRSAAPTITSDVRAQPARIALQIALGTAFLFAKGYRAPEAGAAYARVQALCQQLDESP